MALSIASPTATSLLALKTPFVQPSSCVSLQTTSVSSETYYSVATTLLLPDPSDPRFTACQPPGWANVVPESRFSFSPAVCPQSWTAWWLGRTPTPGAISTTSGNDSIVPQVSTAYCCAPGYSISSLGFRPAQSPSCERAVATTS